MTLRGLLEAGRPVNSLMAGLAVAVGGAVLPVFSSADLAPLAMAGGITFLVTAGGNLVNDFFDAGIDAVNRPERPIPSGRLSRRVALVASLPLLASSLLAVEVNRVALAVAVLNAVLLFVYSWELKGVPLAGNLAVAYLVGSIFLFGGAAVGGTEGLLQGIPLALLAGMATLGREVSKDVEDLPGDRGEVDTLATRFGPGPAGKFAAAVLLGTILLSPVPFLLGISSLYYLPLVTVADGAFTKAAHDAWAGEVEGSGDAQEWAKRGMAVALVAILVGGL